MQFPAYSSVSRRVFSRVVAALSLAAIVGCAYQPVPLPPTGPGPFGRVLFLGDSLTAGFQNGSLLDTQQPNGFAALVAQQAGFPISLPLIAAPGAPAVLKLVSAGVPPVIAQSPGLTTGRDNPGTQPSDLAVPGQTLHDLIYRTPAISTSLADEDIITDLVIGLPVGNLLSQLGEATTLQPTTVFLWTGNNDALLADDLGDPAAMTSLAGFTADYTTLIAALTTRTGAHLVVANIPDVTAVPYMTPAALILSEVSSATGIPSVLVSYLLGIAPGDLVNAQGLTDLEAELAAVSKGGGLTPLPGSDVLTAAEIVQVQAQIDAYNQVIAQLVGRAGGTLVDLHAFYASLGAGVTVNGYHATTGFLGGLFSLDGVHPTNTGYALVANQYISAINAAFGLTTPAVNVSQVAAHDPLFGPNLQPSSAAARAGTAGATHVAHIPAAAARQSSQLIRGFKEAASVPRR